jgi:hypothetical protein
MDVRIGVVQTPKEIMVELAEDSSAEEVRALVAKAPSGDDPVLWFTDRHGRQVGVPSERLAYVEIGRPDDMRRLGFGG